ncbi:LysM peptidoglycan-binding domain-containing protein [Trichococcus shcherbakoviae subsp. psychrophilus]|uniref:Peptidoglycan hydrolase n=1 Tax=Trichococcus shcherbakoviae subsp. psychrophilus TaxID=2585775 RepID=A0A5C5E7S9_9LACT|nr:LysM peptidoglycan-binding domain-containing protein [Trichococcus shcherbakoviae subsp. psychrophilus]
MVLSRNERINQKKKEQLINSFITTNKRLKRSVAVLSTSFFMTTVVKPVQLVLAAESTTLRTTDTQVYSTNPFLNQIIPSATVIAAQNDLYASVMMAQAILESGWGTSTLSKAPNYNLFGIKGEYNGESINMETLEDSGGQNYYPINAEFRKYPSYAESLQDYAAVLANGTSWNPTYYAGAWKSNAATYQDATAYLTGRYATDTAYSTKLNRIIAQYGLDQYDNYQPVVEEEVEEPDAGDIDFETPAETPELPTVELPENTDEDTAEQETPAEPTENTEEAETPTTPETPVQAGDAVHVVQSGDTLYAVAKKYGISLVDLLTLNKLNSNMIYVGDRLVLPDSVVVEEETPAEEMEEETTAPSTPTEKPSDTTTASYTVVAGDTLYKIANANGLTTSELKSLNTLTSDTIYVGQKLLLGKATTTTPDTTENGSNSNTGQTATQSYTVKSGDTLWSIANANSMTVAALKTANTLTSDAIYPGQLLKTTGTSTGTTTPTTGTNTGTTGTTVTGAFIKPASGYISSPFGYRTSPINGALEFHRGIDLAGSGNISASQAGVVEVATYHYSYGNYVVINHGKINGVTIKTLYAHMQSGLSVSVGQTVSQGQKIGVMGTTGSSTGVHLHFEVQENGTVVNPVNYINGTASVTPGVTTPTTTPSTGSSVVVVSGDTLWKIATANGLTVSELKTLNNLTSDAIMTGQTLLLKSAATVTPTTPTTPTVTPGTTTGNVTVASGDTLWKIANANGLSVAELKALNKLTSDVIVPGQTLLLKQTTTTPSVTQPTTPATPTTPSTASTIKVASGDTLWKIANANGLSVSALKALNSLTSDVIVPGQVLTLKSTTVTAPTVTQPTTTAPTTSTTTSTITVATGDTLWKIANANGLAVTELKALNNLSSDYIYPGQSLKVKAAVTTGNTSTVVTTPAVTTPSVPTATNKVYTVQKGDTLYKIASANGVSVADLKTWNSLSTDIIFVSQSLKVAATTTSAQATAPTTSAPAASANSYTVVKGDTLYSIAKKNGVSLAALIEANDITSNVIYVGQVITF